MAGTIVVGVDIGGTKTQLVAARDGITLADRTDATGRWRRHRLDEDAAALVAMVRDAAGGAEPAAIVVGAHGCDSTEQCQVFQALIAARTGGAVLVLNDSELLLPAAGQAMGISVIAGTGSIAVARLPGGAMLTAGGWGWFLGDEGSASGLVRDAARAVRDALDRGQPWTRWHRRCSASSTSTTRCASARPWPPRAAPPASAATRLPCSPPRRAGRSSPAA